MHEEIFLIDTFCAGNLIGKLSTLRVEMEVQVLPQTPPTHLTTRETIMIELTYFQLCAIIMASALFSSSIGAVIVFGFDIQLKARG